MSGINMYKVFVKNRMCKMIFEKVVKSRVGKKNPCGCKTSPGWEYGSEK